MNFDAPCGDRSPLHLVDLTDCPVQLTRLSLRSRHVTDLQHYRIKSDSRQRHSPARSGKEKGRCRSAHNEKCATRFRPKFAPATNLGARAEEIRAHPRDSAWSENHQQEWRVSGVEKSGCYLAAADLQFTQLRGNASDSERLFHRLSG